MPTNGAPLRPLHLIQRDAFTEGVRWFTSLRNFDGYAPFQVQAAADSYYPDPITVPFRLAEDILGNWSELVCEKADHTQIRRFQESLTKFLPQLLALKDNTP